MPKPHNPENEAEQEADLDQPGQPEAQVGLSVDPQKVLAKLRAYVGEPTFQSLVKDVVIEELQQALASKNGG